MAETQQYKQVHSPAGIQTAAIPAEKACAGEFYLQCSWRLILRQFSLETKWGCSLHRLPKLVKACCSLETSHLLRAAITSSKKQKLQQQSVFLCDVADLGLENSPETL